jgi:hypothetical protein
VTPDELAALRAEHQPLPEAPDGCRSYDCDELWPCNVTRLLDALGDAERRGEELPLGEDELRAAFRCHTADAVTHAEAAGSLADSPGRARQRLRAAQSALNSADWVLDSLEVGGAP